MPNPALGASTVAWLSTDATAAENIANAFGAESEAAGLAVCRFEQPDGRWSLVLYFRDPPAEAAVRARVAASAGGDAARALVFETLSPADWVSKSREGLRPVVAGRFVVHTAHDRVRVPANRIAIEIEASLAFGTGHHGSTHGCLLALDRIAQELTGKVHRAAMPSHRRPCMSKADVLDIGTGSGVLAIAAATGSRQRSRSACRRHCWRERPAQRHGRLRHDFPHGGSAGTSVPRQWAICADPGQHSP